MQSLSVSRQVNLMNVVEPQARCEEVFHTCRKLNIDWNGTRILMCYCWIQMGTSG